MVEVPTKAEFDALTAKVTALQAQIAAIDLTGLESRIAAIETVLEALKVQLKAVYEMFYPPTP